MNSYLKEKPVISVIIPVYNTEKYVSTCIESILNQTYSNLQLIIVDDESRDGSLDICKKYAKYLDKYAIICIVMHLWRSCYD